jgi:hypothetical protein
LSRVRSTSTTPSSKRPQLFVVRRGLSLVGRSLEISQTSSLQQTPSRRKGLVQQLVEQELLRRLLEDLEHLPEDLLEEDLLLGREEPDRQLHPQQEQQRRRLRLIP